MFVYSNCSSSASLFGTSAPFRLTKLSAACALGILFATTAPLSYAIDGNENGGKVEIPQGDVLEDSTDIYGYDFGGDADAQGGRVTIKGTITHGAAIVGGRTLRGDAIENSVIVDGGNVKSSRLYGGYGQGAHGNRVEIINKANVTSSAENRNLNIAGAVIRGESIGSDNHVLISGNSTVNAAVYGARASEADLSLNTVIVTDSTVTHLGSVLYGAYSGRGDVTDNSVTVTGSDIKNTSSSQESPSITGGYSQAGNANSNTVSISASTVNVNATSNNIESVIGGFSDEGNASENTVTIADSTVTGNVTGCQAPNGFADNNAVVVTDSTAYGDIYGGQSNFGQANGNQVTVTGDQDVNLGNIWGGWSGELASNNTVTLDASGKIKNVVGGNVLSNRSMCNK